MWPKGMYQGRSLPCGCTRAVLIQEQRSSLLILFPYPQLTLEDEIEDLVLASLVNENVAALALLQLARLCDVGSFQIGNRVK